jgi:Na+/H+-dicarboxylate symporter
LGGLALGLGLGILLPASPQAATVARLIGGLWLDGLKMTIIPLVVALLIVGIAGTARSARGSRLAFRAVLLFIGLLWVSALVAAMLVPALLGAWPLPAETGALLRAGLGGGAAVAGAAPDLESFIRSVIPTNPVSAAAEEQLLPLILFTGLFAIALTRLPEAQAAPVIGFFTAIADAMLVIIGWVLWLAPLGVAGLGYGLGASVGAAAVGALGHYIIIVSASGLAIWALSLPVAVLGGGISLLAFARASGPVLAVALSTQSSLASLPSMLKATEELGVPPRIAKVTLPLAVAIFRVTGPAMNLAVAIYVAHWFDIALTPTALAAGVAVAAVTSISSVSLPGQLSFLTSISPIALVMGVPLEPLALLVAVEMLPDLVRTGSNVSMDMATTTLLSRFEPKDGA